MSNFNIADYLNSDNSSGRYARQIERLRKGVNVGRFHDATDKAIANINNSIQSFVIYGDPQSGKTEMMILLTAKLLDAGHKIIIVLLNDNDNLLEQNSERFAFSGLDPTPKVFTEVIDPNIIIGNQEWVIFCKKNSKNLQKLIDKIGGIRSKIVIDDECDYATPNQKINQEEQTKINKLVEHLLGDGVYIGVTATPARLDLNNTFNNASVHWIYFKPHEKYTGQDTFFPINGEPQYLLQLLPDEYDDPKYLRKALLSFFVNVAYLNLNLTTEENEKNYCMLVHTSGKRVDHSGDYKQIIDVFNILNNQLHKDYAKLVEKLFNIVKKRFNSGREKELVQYILKNIGRNKVVIMNSDNDKKSFNYKEATNPVALFTVAIGGNIISRGVTFDNLLSMFFTRDVKHKIQQDTYIQRARMFGARETYLKYFELTIPEKLYSDWHKCFVFHRLSLQSAISGNTPVWLEDRRVQSVSSGSVDKATVGIDSGEMSFAIFTYSPKIENVLNDSGGPFQVIDKLHNFLGNDCLPKFLLKFIKKFSPDGTNSLAIHKTTNILNRGDDVNKELIYRAKGFIGNSELEKDKFPHAIHHIKIFYSDNKARVFYRYIENVKFLKNKKNHDL